MVSLLTILSYSAFSQARPDSTGQADQKSSLQIGTQFLSNNVFMGRTGRKAVPIISPDFKYMFASGLYFAGDMDIVPGLKKDRINGGSLTAGYDFDLTRNLEGGISYSKMFYNANSTLVGASMTNIFNFNLDYNIDHIITPSVSVDYSLNNRGVANDIFLNAGLSHDFISHNVFDKKDALIISPTVSVNWGTQNFYEAYIERKTNQTERQLALMNTFESRLNQFQLLDYEISVPFDYKIKHFIAHFTPTYAIVQNGFKSGAVARAVGLSNNSSVLYFEMGVGLKF
ncbi:hypothetical protein [Mucilaginibacter sp. CSA2-8R]|uniref:hypothetical protein n=1 Tax=Mucilaginibacter sp. CSA2-8R TaxID=3141542 RepID=UPI00315C9A28